MPTLHWNATEKYLRAWKAPSVDTVEEFVQSNKVSDMEVLPGADGQWEASLKMADEKTPDLFWKYQFISNSTGGWTLKGGKKWTTASPWRS